MSREPIRVLAQDLEGSRFVISQLYSLAASGSREQPLLCQNPAPHLRSVSVVR